MFCCNQAMFRQGDVCFTWTLLTVEAAKAEEPSKETDECAAEVPTVDRALF